MCKKLNGIRNYLINANVLCFVGVFLGLIFFTSAIATISANFFNIKDAFKGADLSKYNLMMQAFIAIILGPVIETTIYQYIIIKLCKFITGKNIFGIIISALCFGISHQYNLFYMITGIIIGLILSICFVLAEYRKEPAFILVVSVHALHNLFALIAYQFPD